MYVKVATVSDVPLGAGRVFEAAGRAIAVFNVEGRFYALDNACPHRGGPLGEGEVEGALVRCPWHARRWDVRTGTSANNPALSVACYAVAVEDGAVLVALDPEPVR